MLNRTYTAQSNIY
jgi:hypothetical protein